MLRRLLIAPVAVVALAAASPTPAAGATRPAGVKVAECSLEDASALFVARMRQVEGSERMSLRFKLLEKAAAGYHTLSAPGLGRWRRSKPGVGAFSYKQAVKGLEAGSLYRAQVDFRWYDADGNLIQTDRRRSAPCRQFDVLPNLTATPIAGKQTDKGVVRYQVLVTNEGIAPATGVPVRVTVDGAVVDTVVVPVLQPAERRIVSVPGPACSRSVEAEADPDDVIVESSEADNAHEIPCADLRRG
jgi:CARDB protein